MVPFPHDIDYHSFVIQIPQAEVEAGNLVQILLEIPESEIQRRRKAMRDARALLRFDFSGSAPDAFSATVGELWRFLQLQRGTGTGKDSLAPAFDCGMPPGREGDGTLMYGHMACVCQMKSQLAVLLPG
eukprot:TRINITY_DN33261_c0_g1_i1.p1 TRINITY_DN33261_c0_g1~~TRINITY_DN33261_c0_g1_i1.p1  ORF type:complete len:129 (-),score=14.89 TRINITY_DN33261_c0_g1_i1:519-905(-)